MTAFRSAMDRALERPIRGIDWLGYLLLAIVYILFIWAIDYLAPYPSMVPLA